MTDPTHNDARDRNVGTSVQSPRNLSHDEDVRLDRSITDAFCAECPSTACDLPGDQAKCATLLLIGSIWARGTDLYYALMEEHEVWSEYRALLLVQDHVGEEAVLAARLKAFAAHDKVEGMRYDS